VYKKLIINVTEHETRVALLEDGTIAEFFIERRDDSDITGNIYKGRVQRVLPGMQAAFVDIGLEKHAFLYVTDFVEDDEEYEVLFSEAEKEVEKFLSQEERGDAPARRSGTPGPRTPPSAARGRA
jgi:ribonuclease G